MFNFIKNSLSIKKALFKKWTIILLTLVFLQIVSFSLIFSHFKTHIQSVWNPHQDRLLSTVVGDISGNGHYIKALKFKTPEGIRLELLKAQSREEKELVNDIVIPHPYNGFFEYRGQSVQLAMGDVNGDGVMEVMAPTFDKDLKPYLNVYYYHENHDNFHNFEP